MLSRLTLLTGSGLILSGLTGAATPDGLRLAYGPEAGLALSRTLENTMSFELDDMSMVVGGQDLGAMMGDMVMSMELVNEVSFDDKLVAIGEGRPTHLERAVLEATQDMTMDIEVMGEGDSQDMSYSAGLVGRTMILKWNAENEAYDVSYKEEQEGDRPPLYVIEDLDMRSFLPTEAVDVDDSWEPGLEGLFGLFSMGGDLRWVPEFDEELAAEMMEMQAQMEDMTREFMHEAMQEFEEAIEGESEAIYKGTREVDGRNLGVIDYSIDVEMSYDFVEWIGRAVDSMGDMEGMPEDFFMEADAANMDGAMEASGTMLWDLEAGVMHSISMSGDIEFSFDFAGLVGAMGEELDMEMSMGMFGSFEHASSASL